MIWYVHLREDGSIASAHQERQDGYAEKAVRELAGTPIATFLEAARNSVPQTASAGDFIRALYEFGWLEDVKKAVAAADGLAAELWARSATFERGHALVLQIARAIGKTEADLDALFRKAGTYS